MRCHACTKRRQSLAGKRVYQGMLEARARWKANTTPIPLKTLRTVAVSVYLWVWTGCILVSSYGLEGQKAEVFGCLRQHRKLGPGAFFGAFGLKGSRNDRLAAARSFNINVESISEDCSVAMDAVQELLMLSHGTPAEPRAKEKAKKEASASSTRFHGRFMFRSCLNHGRIVRQGK